VGGVRSGTVITAIRPSPRSTVDLTSCAHHQQQRPCLALSIYGITWPSLEVKVRVILCINKADVVHTRRKSRRRPQLRNRNSRKSLIRLKPASSSADKELRQADSPQKTTEPKKNHSRRVSPVPFVSFWSGRLRHAAKSSTATIVPSPTSSGWYPFPHPSSPGAITIKLSVVHSCLQ
jgi:hypothetical protein